MDVVPEPASKDIPFNEPVRRRLGAGERLTATFSPEQNQTVFHVPALGISKHPEMFYRVKADGRRRFESETPPTDVDDMGVTFIPTLRFQQKLTVIVENLSSSTTRPVIVQPIGWEEVEG